MHKVNAKEFSGKGYKQYDLHTHTNASYCSSLAPETLVKAAIKKGLDGVAITDHNTIRGALNAAEYVKRHRIKNFEVIVGEEVSTEFGHTLVLFLKEKIPPGKLAEVIKAAKKQDALVIIAHPFTLLRRTKSHNYASLKKFRKDIHGIECLNARIFVNHLNRKAWLVAEDFHLAKTAGSDGHFAFELGRGKTLFKGNLKQAILKRKTFISGVNIPISPGSALSLIKMVKRRRFSD